MTKSNFSCVETGFFSGSRHCASVLQTQVPKLCTDLDHSLLYILIFGTYSKFTRENNFLALGVCFPQPYSSAGHRFAESRLRLQTFRLHNKNLDEMRCKMDSTENPRSFEKYYLKKIATKTKKKVGVSKTCVILGKQLHLAQPWRVLGGWARTKITWSS